MVKKFAQRLFITFPRNIITSGKIRRRALKTLKVLLALIIIFAVSYGAFDYYASFLLKQEYAIIRQQGEPLFFAEVAANNVPDAENAALLYIKAAEELTLPERYYFQMDAPIKQKVSVIHDNPKVMPLVERTSQMIQSHFPVESKGPPDNWINLKFSKMPELTRFISLNAEENSRRKNYTKAFEQIGYIDRLAASTANGDTLIGFLVARSIQGIGIRTTYTILQNAQLTKQQAQTCVQLLPHSDWHQLFYDTMIGERTFNISANEYLLSDIWNRKASEEDDWDIDDSASFQHKGFVTRPLLKMNEVYLLRLWQKVLLQAKKPGALDANFETHITDRLNQLPFYAIQAKITQEIYLGSFENRDRTEVAQRQREIAIVLNAYKTEHGAYPESLTTAEQFWGTNFPADPYNNKPFHYRAENHNYTLYSVGKNRLDDGGIKQQKDEWDYNKITDLIWGDYPTPGNKKEETK